MVGSASASILRYHLLYFPAAKPLADNGGEDYSRNTPLAAPLPDARLLHPAGARFSVRRNGGELRERTRRV